MPFCQLSHALYFIYSTAQCIYIYSVPHAVVYVCVCERDERRD